MEWMRKLGARTIARIETIGRASLILAGAIFAKPQLRKHFPIFMKQMHVVGFLSLPIILVSGLFIGMVMALQAYIVLVDFGAEDSLGPMVSLSLLRELGPVVTALLFAGRAGSALTAEIGLMKATEQLSSLEMMAVDPLRRVIGPRFWAGFFSMPMLAIIFSATGILGGHLVGVDWLGVDNGSYWSIMQSTVQLSSDVGNGIIKSFVFAFVTTWIAVFKGYDCIPTSEGISQATTQTVVYSSLSILGLDFVLTALMFGTY